VTFTPIVQSFLSLPLARLQARGKNSDFQPGFRQLLKFLVIKHI